MKFDLIIVGVGGQGTILASNVIGISAVKEGIPIKAAETHGMAQRGGSVENHVRIGCKYGPLIPKGSADALLGFEPAEAVKHSHFLSRDGVAIINTEKIIPLSTTSKGFKYPDIDYLISEFKRVFKNVITLNAAGLAREAGSIMTVNTVMLGVLTRYLPIKERIIVETITELVPKKLVEVNLRAFEAGRNVVAA
ncbi:indolepyruvate oxidoreductase subunit beta [Candidatus Aerophobetes bacterium]|nr:indolepyruvate oxidoreductase subunit beta [Candidatus Aerophobetes bacterium]